MSGQQRFYITTPIFYPNGAPHIGHAYTALATDVIARFERLDGKDVFFLTGTDEHGLKMQQTAAAEGLTPQALADRNSQVFRDMMAALDVSQDDFIRTTEPRHYRSSEELWRRMEKAGDIYLGKYAGWYSVRQEAYFDEKETTLGPDGVRREPLGSPVEWTEEETYFFRLSAFQERLLAHYAKHPDFILPPERRNEVASFVKAGLDDLSISRTTVEWGIKVPDPTVGVRPLAQADARDTTAEGRGLTPANTPAEHVMYVWVDALTNYITAAGFPDAKAPRWRYWPADVHIIGKDIVRFHAVYWPAFLMSAGVEPPKRVFAHGFLYNRGEKMSKSVGNVVDPFDLVRGYGVDQVRYFFLREAAFGQDGTYSHEAIVNRINADLANDLGNLAQRSLSMIHKNCDAKLPGPGALTDADRTILAAADGLYATAREAMDRQGIKHYLDAVWTVVADANRYFAGEEPWAKRKSEPERMGTILYVTAEAVRQVAILAAPVVPTAAGKLLDALGQGADARSFKALGEAGRLVPGTPIPPPTGVFPRYVEPADAEPEPEAKPKKPKPPRKP
jgi:methionyl-tRNA synthetase